MNVQATTTTNFNTGEKKKKNRKKWKLIESLSMHWLWPYGTHSFKNHIYMSLTYRRWNKHFFFVFRQLRSKRKKKIIIFVELSNFFSLHKTSAWHEERKKLFSNEISFYFYAQWLNKISLKSRSNFFSFIIIMRHACRTF